ncbi:hypothetical protein [Nocardia gipuzkoensis]|uniref:hypothetical protein n=1 Tax=Nocardia gipuzkoensis TaxID=2749991 RepID=UPI00237DBF60|nr:hypothetical protein [Nocardia gipuzkoensis]MDE1668834.1 hypothetical protein [Nocardia gipuzkoensis]
MTEPTTDQKIPIAPPIDVVGFAESLRRQKQQPDTEVPADAEPVQHPQPPEGPDRVVYRNTGRSGRMNWNKVYEQ